jgi:hypothetical protein
VEIGYLSTDSPGRKKLEKKETNKRRKKLEKKRLMWETTNQWHWLVVGPI